MDPVGMTGTRTCALSESFMTAPWPYLRSMVPRAVFSASRRASSGETTGFFAILRILPRMESGDISKRHEPGQEAEPLPAQRSDGSLASRRAADGDMRNGYKTQ